MKNTHNFLLFPFFAILSLLIFANSCKKEENKEKPVLSTSGISGISETAAKSGGNITSSGGAAITARGVCWSIAATPTIADNKTIDGTGEGTFVSNLSGLSQAKLIVSGLMPPIVLEQVMVILFPFQHQNHQNRYCQL